MIFKDSLKQFFLSRVIPQLGFGAFFLGLMGVILPPILVPAFGLVYDDITIYAQSYQYRPGTVSTAIQFKSGGVIIPTVAQFFLPIIVYILPLLLFSNIRYFFIEKNLVEEYEFKAIPSLKLNYKLLFMIFVIGVIICIIGFFTVFLFFKEILTSWYSFIFLVPIVVATLILYLAWVGRLYYPISKSEILLHQIGFFSGTFFSYKNPYLSRYHSDFLRNALSGVDISNPLKLRNDYDNNIERTISKLRKIGFIKVESNKAITTELGRFVLKNNSSRLWISHLGKA